MQEFSFGIPVVGASSTDLEWLAKPVAVYICREFAGTVLLLCDNASVQLCDFHEWVRVNPSIDRVAEHILGLPVWSRVCELWLPTQHDTHHCTLGAQGQARSNQLVL